MLKDISSRLQLVVFCILLISVYTYAATNITLAFTANVRGQFVPYYLADQGGNYTASSCYGWGQCVEATHSQLNAPGTYFLGGCVNRNRYFRKLRKDLTDRSVVVVDAGGFYWGSSYPAVVPAECINYSQYDVINIAASDLYNGTHGLAEFIRSVNPTTDVIASNLDLDPTREPHLTNTTGATRPPSYVDGLFVSYSVRDIGNVKMLFIGVIIEEFYTFPVAQTIRPTSATGIDIIFRINKAIFDAKKQHSDVDVIVGLFEMPYIDAAALAREVENLDIVIYNRFWEDDPLPDVSAPLTSFYGHPVYLISVGSQVSGTRVGRLDFTVDDTTGSLSDVSYRREVMLSSDEATLGPKETDDDVFLQTLANYREALEKLNSEVISRTSAVMSSNRGLEDVIAQPSFENVGCRNFDCALGRLVVEGYRQACLLTDQKVCDIAIINGGMLRSAIPVNMGANSPFDITLLDASLALPYRNQIVTQRLQGSTIRKVFDNSAKQIGDGGFLQTNLRVAYFYNLAAVNEGDAVVEIMITNSNGERVSLVDEEYYTVAMPTYLYEGGDGYGTTFTTVGGGVYGPVDTDVVVDLLRSYRDQSKVYPAMDNELLKRCMENKLPWITAAETNCYTLFSDVRKSDYNYCPTNVNVCNEPPGLIGMAGMFVNSTTDGCKSCSGLGSCYLRKCTCDTPQEGLFKNVPIVRGDNCAEIASMFEVNDGVLVVVLLLTAVACIVCIVTGCLIVYFADRRAIKATSPKIGLVMCGAGILIAIGTLFDLRADAIDVGCMPGLWLITIGYVVLFGCLFMRTYRIHRIFNGGRAIRSVVFTDMDLLKRVGCLLAIDLLILILFTSIDPLVETGLLLDTSDFSVIVSCRGNDSIFMTVLLVFNGVLLVWGIYLAVSTRNVESNFNESTFIGAAVYNCAFVSVVVVPLVLLLRETNPDVTHALQSIGILYVLIFTMAVVYVPRFIRAHRNEQGTSGASSNVQMTSVTNSADGHVPMAYTDYIRMLEMKLKALGQSISRPHGVSVPTSTATSHSAASAVSAVSANHSATSKQSFNTVPSSSSGSGATGTTPTLRKPEAMSIFDKQNSLRDKSFRFPSSPSFSAAPSMPSFTQPLTMPASSSSSVCAIGGAHSSLPDTNSTSSTARLSSTPTSTTHLTKSSDDVPPPPAYDEAPPPPPPSDQPPTAPPTSLLSVSVPIDATVGSRPPSNGSPADHPRATHPRSSIKRSSFSSPSTPSPVVEASGPRSDGRYPVPTQPLPSPPPQEPTTQQFTNRSAMSPQPASPTPHVNAHGGSPAQALRVSAAPPVGRPASPAIPGMGPRGMMGSKGRAYTTGPPASLPRAYVSVNSVLPNVGPTSPGAPAAAPSAATGTPNRARPVLGSAPPGNPAYRGQQQ